MIIRFLASLALALSFSIQAWACSCVGIENKKVSEHVHGDVIFVGRPISSRFDPSEDEWGNDVVTTFEVQRRLQGEFVETIEIRHGQSGASCGVQFTLGEIQLVAAHQTDFGLQTGLCSNPLPEMLIVNYFEKHEDLHLMSRWDCKESNLLTGGDEYGSGEKALTPECNVFTLGGKNEYYQGWQAWLKINEISTR